MSSIADKQINYRVLVDWDADGFFNVGIPASVPPNLFPDPLYASGSFLRGFDAAFTTDYFTDVIESSERGLIKRSIRMGDQALSIRLMMNDYLPFQPQAGDAINLFGGSPANAFFPKALSGLTDVLEVGGLVQAGDPLVYRARAVEVPLGGANTGKVGNYAAKIGESSDLVLPCAALGYTQSAAAYFSLSTTASYTHVFPVDGAPTYSGIPVVAGSTYTLIYYVYLPQTIAGNGSVTSYVYSNNSAVNGTAKPHNDRDFLQSVNPTVPYNTWTLVRHDFTVPSGSATHVAVDFRGSGSSERLIYVGGFMLLAGNVATPTRMWDNTINFSREQFSVVFPGDNQAYHTAFYVKSPNGIDKLKPTRHVSIIGTTTTTSTVLADIPVTTAWTRVDFPIAASTSERGVWYTFTAEKGGSAVGAGNAGDVEFSGFMTTLGATATYPFHAGGAYGYEDLTNNTLTVSTRNGKKDFSQPLPQEGSANIQLNNDSQIYSPNNPASPIYGLMQQNLKVKIQFQDPLSDIWVDIWSGWTRRFDITPGRTTNRQATISASQGLYRLAEGVLSIPATPTTTMDVFAKTIIENSGWRSTAVVLQSFVGLDTDVEVNAYTMDDALLYGTVETGINRIELAGKDWSNRTDPRRALEDVLGAENAQLWVGRSGEINIVNRDHWIATNLAGELVLDTAANQAEYRYDAETVNAVEVTIVPNKSVVENPVWQSKRPIRVRPRGTFSVQLDPRFQEGSPKTVLEYKTENITKDVYIVDIGIESDAPNPDATAEQSDAVIVELLGLDSGRPQVRLTNNNAITVWVNIAVEGTVVSTGDSIIVSVEDEASIERIQGKHLATYSNPLLTDIDYAESYAEYLILRQANPLGEFPSFTIPVRSQEDIDTIFGLPIGSIISLAEKQSAETAQLHAIIGEDFEISSSRTMTVTFHTARTLQEQFFKASESVLKDATVNIIPDIYNAQPLRGGGEFIVESGEKYGLDKIMKWATKGAYSPELLLAPARSQVQIFQPLAGVDLWPTTDASGNAFNPLGVLTKVEQRRYAPLSSLWFLPDTEKMVLWYTQNQTRKTMTATGTAQAFLLAERSKTTDESVGAASTFVLFVPVTPAAKYRATGFAVLSDINQNPAGAFPTGQQVAAISQSGALLQNWSGGAGSAGLPSGVGIVGIDDIIHDFKARDSAGVDVSLTGFRLYNKTAAFEPEGLLRLELVRYTGNFRYGTPPLNTAIGHYYTVFVSIDGKSPSPITVYLDVYDDSDGSLIGTNSALVTNATATKLSVTVASGKTAIFGKLRLDDVTGTDLRFIIHAYGITTAPVSTPADLFVTEDQQLVYA